MESQADDTNVVILEFLDSDRREWDDFVLAHPHSSPFHLIAWKNTIEESYRYKPVYLLARDPRGVRGVLPLFLVRNLAVGKALISSPFGVYGGILADSPAARQNLIAALRNWESNGGWIILSYAMLFQSSVLGNPMYHGM